MFVEGSRGGYVVGFFVLGGSFMMRLLVMGQVVMLVQGIRRWSP